MSRGRAERGRVLADRDKKGTGDQSCKVPSRPYTRTLVFIQSYRVLNRRVMWLMFQNDHNCCTSNRIFREEIMPSAFYS